MSRRGTSLVELLTVMVVVGLLLGIILPAAREAREAARRTACQDNLRQLAAATLHHESSRRRLPAATAVAATSAPSGCKGCLNPWAEARLPPLSFPPGTKHGTSWILAVLPYLDEAGLHDRWNRSTNVLGNAAVAQSTIPVLLCPSRRAGIRTDRHDHRNLPVVSWLGGGTDYGGCYGRLDGFMNDTADDRRFADVETPIVGSQGSRQGIFRPGVGTPLKDVEDGLAATIMLGELQRLRPLPGATSAAATYNRTSQDGWAVGGAATLFVTATDPAHGNPGGINNAFFESPGSEHRGGCFFAMADGSVRWLGGAIDAADNNGVFPRLGSIRDGRPTGFAASGR
ncbi:MAG: DUF1559 domain-containing protein [Planctomycetia bacterium]